MPEKLGTDESLRKLVEWILPAPATCPAWPPDVFAVAAAILRASGAFVRVAEVCPARPHFVDGEWVGAIRSVGTAWRAALDSGGGVDAPAEVQGVWAAILRRGKVRLLGPGGLLGNDELVRDLLWLVAVADEASRGVGVVPSGASGERFHQRAEAALARGRFRTVCERVSPGRACVLPKQHTPQRGLTLRSLTHHLALMPNVDLVARWELPVAPRVGAPGRVEILGVLLLPWPLEVAPSDFTLVPLEEPGTPHLSRPHRFFRYRREAEDTDRLCAYVESAIAEAQARSQGVQVVVMPELAIDGPQLRRVRDVVRRAGALLVTGVAMEPAHAPELQLRGPANVAVVDRQGWSGGPADHPSDALLSYQKKHHRWCLDGPQIRQYGLTGYLPTSRDCWEYAEIGPRELTVFTLDRWLSVSVLICEDLARQDPAADVVRTIAPTLLIALLMDGPQLRERWPSRYAAVLGEDPGTSVLTLTCLGMARLARPLEDGRPSRERVIGMWRDVHSGYVELELAKPDDNAMLLNVVCRSREEFTADGRGDGGTAHFPILAGVESFRAEPETKDRKRSHPETDRVDRHGASAASPVDSVRGT